MADIATGVVSIADACLGGLQDRSALLIGSEALLFPYKTLLRRAGMKQIYQEDTVNHIATILPSVHLLISTPLTTTTHHLQLTAAQIARGCAGRRTPLLIFDLAPYGSVEEMAGLLPAVCLYTPDDIQRMLPGPTCIAS